MNGKAGQKLKVFHNYCIVDTKNETKKNELVNMFDQFEEEKHEEDIKITAEQKSNLMKGLMSGRVQAVIGYMASAAINKEEKEKLEEKKEIEREKKIGKLIKVGEHKIYYANIGKVDVYSAANTANGYLRLIPNNVSSDNLYECEYFFFNNSIPFENTKIALL